MQKHSNPKAMSDNQPTKVLRRSKRLNPASETVSKEEELETRQPKITKKTKKVSENESAVDVVGLTNTRDFKTEEKPPVVLNHGDETKGDGNDLKNESKKIEEKPVLLNHSKVDETKGDGNDLKNESPSNIDGLLQKLLAFKKFSENQTFVSLNLVKKLISTEAKDKNIVLSPLSIHLILGVLAASSTGQIQKEVLEYLKSESSEDFNSWMSQTVNVVFADGSLLGGPNLSCATAAWVDKSFTLKHKLKETVGNAYKTVMDEIDFQNKPEVDAAVKKVNEWAKVETNGLIEEIISRDSVEPLTRLIFGNAVYFKGAWVEKFPSYLTRNRKFFLNNSSSVLAPFMGTHGNEKQYASAFNGFKVLGLPYKQGKDKRRFSMYIFLPDAIDGLPALLNKITAEPGFIEHHIPYERVFMEEFHVPKFKICFQFEASKALKALGLVSPFTRDSSQMVDENLFVSSVSHKSFIEVNEHGTEAAAVTVSMRGGGYVVGMEFVADHPFLFVIREGTTGMLLFIGQVLNPLISE